MRVVGLVSGGKDSIWNLHYCHHLKHEICCLAHLAPPEGVLEMDSYMYQTVGSELVTSIAEAMGLPLVRRCIAGAPKRLDSAEYAPEEGDEVEDLTLLLQDVLQAFPGVEAVSCGAILSDYQRCRVEHVCGRLKLKVLAFLWRQEQPLLLRQMIAGGLDARIVKVACMGLDQRHIGRSILESNFAAHLFGLGQKWGVHVCGEGGEYESAVFDAPLYRERLALPEGAWEAISHPSGDADDVALMAIREVPKREEKEDVPSEPQFEDYTGSHLKYYRETYPPMTRERIDELISPQDSSCWQRCSSTAAEIGHQGGAGASDAGGAGGAALRSLRSGAAASSAPGALWATSSLDVRAMQLGSSWESAAAECDALLMAIAEWLALKSRHLKDVAFAEVQVRDLSCFEEVNAAYAKHFVENPPARVCIETPLPPGVQVRLRLLLRPHEGASARDALRVQSISTWAMACIGPYSQAQRLAPDLLCSSGVLGLVPHSMALPKVEDLTQAQAELWLLMRSLLAVLQVMGSGFQEVSLAQVYVTAGVGLEICQEVLAYFRQTAPELMPLISFAEVPRLPKGGCVEITVMCSSDSLGIRIAEASAERPSQLPALAQQLRCMLEREAQDIGGSLAALQVQFCPADAESAIQDAMQAIAATDGPALSYMPVSQLHLAGREPTLQLRCIGRFSDVFLVKEANDVHV
ncbi:unnamed protein product [Durusdinium trenchii]|uniref:Diphthine--ammonia ligase n=1 Tax=Durusdinium trenchii TaxID=1381693 RepID=A0ABP0N3M6_9DINO